MKNQFETNFESLSIHKIHFSLFSVRFEVFFSIFVRFLSSPWPFCLTWIFPRKIIEVSRRDSSFFLVFFLLGADFVRFGIADGRETSRALFTFPRIQSQSREDSFSRNSFLVFRVTKEVCSKWRIKMEKICRPWVSSLFQIESMLKQRNKN